MFDQRIALESTKAISVAVHKEAVAAHGGSLDFDVPLQSNCAVGVCVETP
jgi:hypothetical protein